MLPRGGFDTKISSFSGPEIAGLKSKKQAVRIDTILKDDAQVTVVGFGLPFAHHGHISEAWLDSSAPLAGNVTLLDLLRQRSFSFIVDEYDKVMNAVWDESTLGPVFVYPYGNDHEWDFDRYEKLLPANKVSQRVSLILRCLLASSSLERTDSSD